MDPLVQSGSQGHQVLRALRDPRVSRAHLGKLGRPVAWVNKEILGPLDHAAPLVLLERRVNGVSRVKREHKGKSVSLEPLELTVNQARQENPALKASPAPRAPLGLLGLQALMDSQVHPEAKGTLDPQVPLVLMELQVHPEK